MCFSAIVKQDVKNFRFKFPVRMDYDLILEMMDRRLKDDSIKISKAFEKNFKSPSNKSEKEILKLIEEYRSQKTAKLEEELFKQKKRLADAERKLQTKETKKSLEDQRISSQKIKWALGKISTLQRETLEPMDSRIFPMTYAPIIVEEKGEYLVKLARYHCRPEGKPASIDFKYNGLYNARRDNLTNAFWKDLFGKKHAFFVVDSFYENVAKHDYEKRKLGKSEEPENIVLHFNPNRGGDMLVACLYDYWSEKDKDGFYSFAAVTGEPTPEIAATGHERLIIALKEQNLEKWLQPKDLSSNELYQILDDPEQFRYEHELAG